MTEMIPLIIFTVFGGIAAGALLCSAFASLKQPEGGDAVPFVKRPAFFALICLVLLAIGLCGTLAHLGQPLRFINGLSNPASMISQEGYWSIALGVVLVIALVLGLKRDVPRILTIVGGIVALGMMIVTSLAYYFAAGIPSWNTGATFMVIIVGDIAMGAALCALLIEDGRKLFIGISAMLGAVMLITGIVLQAEISALHSSFDLLPWTAFSMIIAGVLPLCVWGAHIKGLLDSRLAAISMLVLMVVGVAILRIGFFAVGMA